MISSDFYPTVQTYADGEIERTDTIDNLGSYDIVGSPYYLGYIEHDDFPKSFGVSLVDYARGMAFKRVESNHSWGYCFNKNVFNSTGFSPALIAVQDSTGLTSAYGGDRYCFLNKIKMAQQNFDRTVTYTAYIMYIPTSSIDDDGTAPFAYYATSSINRTVTFEQLKNIIDGTSNVLNAWTSSSVNYPDVKYSDFNEYGLAMIPALDANRTAVICIARVSLENSGRYSYGTSDNDRSAVFPFFEHDIDDKHILVSQGDGFVLDPEIVVYYDLGIIRPDVNFGIEHNGQFYTPMPYPDINFADLPEPDTTYQTSVLIKGQYFLKWSASTTYSHIRYKIYAHYDLKDVYTLMLYYHKMYTGSIVFSKSYTTDVSVATFNDHDGATGDRLSDDYANISDQLRDWQQPDTDIAVNEYDPADKPEYDPSGDTEDEESGQSIPIQRRLLMGAVSSFITCYGLTAAQVQEFGKKLWSSWVDNGGLVMAMVENFKFLIDSGIASNTGSIDISSVLDFVVSLKVYPCDLTHLFAFSNNGMDGKVYIGRGTYGLEVSNTAIFKAINQIGYLDAGTYNVPRPFGDFRDYTNINITVYVPYCGTIELNPADVIGRTLSGTYVVDVMTGECTFYLEVYAVTDSGEHRYVVGTCDGQIGVTIPVSATNSGQIAARRFSDVAQFATTVGGFFNRNMQISNDIAMQMATLGASGMASKNPEMASAREQNIKMAGSQAYADNALGLLKDVTGQFGNSLTRAAIDAPNISGGSGIASFANPDCVWIQIRHGIYPKVDNYNHTVGKVSTKSAPLSSYHGFTVCHNVDVSSLPCTEEEKSAIKQLLETGVYL